MSLPRLHLVTSDAVLEADGFAARARAVLERHGEGVLLQIRGHGLSGRRLFEMVAGLGVVAEATGTPLLVNDRVDIALGTDAAGAQLGRRSIPPARARALLGADRLLGYSAHAVEEACEAVAAGADFVVLGTIFASASHPGEPGAGPNLVEEAAARVAAPVVAIGGITPERAERVCAAGAHGVAVLSGVWGSDDPAAAADAYLSALEG